MPGAGCRVYHPVGLDFIKGCVCCRSKVQRTSWGEIIQGVDLFRVCLCTDRAMPVSSFMSISTLKLDESGYGCLLPPYSTAYRRALRTTRTRLCVRVGRRPIHGHGYHLGGNPGANPQPISHRCYLFEVAFVWELTKKNIHLPLSCHGVRIPFPR